MIHSFFFNTTTPTEIYTLSLHDALPISLSDSELSESSIRFDVRMPRTRRSRWKSRSSRSRCESSCSSSTAPTVPGPINPIRSEEHTSELQSQSNLVCRLLLEKKKKKNKK